MPPIRELIAAASFVVAIGLLARRTLTSRLAAWWGPVAAIALSGVMVWAFSARPIAVAALLGGGLAVGGARPARWADPLAGLAGAVAVFIDPAVGFAALVGIVAATPRAAAAFAIALAGVSTHALAGPWTWEVVILGTIGALVAWLAAQRSEPRGRAPRERQADILARAGAASGVLALLVVDDRLSLFPPDDVTVAGLAGIAAAMLGVGAAVTVVGALLLRAVDDPARRVAFAAVLYAPLLGAFSIRAALVALAPFLILSAAAGAAYASRIYARRLARLWAEGVSGTSPRRPKRG